MLVPGQPQASPLRVCTECRLVNDGRACMECGAPTIELSSGGHRPPPHPLYGHPPVRPAAPALSDAPLVFPNTDEVD